jgi:hypothetical protein
VTASVISVLTEAFDWRRTPLPASIKPK